MNFSFFGGGTQNGKKSGCMDVVSSLFHSSKTGFIKKKNREKCCRMCFIHPSLWGIPQLSKKESKMIFLP